MEGGTVGSDVEVVDAAAGNRTRRDGVEGVGHGDEAARGHVVK